MGDKILIVDVSTYTGKHRPFLYVLWKLIKTQPSLFIYLFEELWFYLLFKTHIWQDEKYQEKRWAFLKRYNFENLDKAFKKRKVNPFIKFDKETEVVDQYPDVILELLASGCKVNGLKLNEEKNIEYTSLISRMSDKDVVVSPTTAAHNSLPNNYRIYFNKHFYTSYSKYLWSQVGFIFRDVIVLGILSVIFAILTTWMSGHAYNTQMVSQVLHSKKLLFYNTLPIYCLMLVLYAIFNSLSWSAAISGFIFVFLGLVNFFMLEYRSFPFKYSDIFLSGEAMNMGHRYSYMPPVLYLLIIAGLILLLVGLHFLIKPAKQSFIKTVVIILASVGIWTVFYNKFYVNDTYYKQIANVKYGSPWNETDQYMTKGFSYSFIHSTNELGLKAPAGYSDHKALSLLHKYKYQAIPKKKRINVILIQLEAFQDFSKYKNLKIDPSVYAGLNQVRKESMHGNLTTTIFGGGTVDTERKSLTGYSVMQPLNSDTSSFVRYFNANKYYTLKLHPGHGWFYNRQNIAKYLGFDKFLYKENYYNKNVSDAQIVKDKLAFADLEKQFDKYTKNNKQLFTQLVTYQNHGPYPTIYSGKTWLPYKSGYDKDDYAIINNYLNGAKQTSDQLLNLINNFKKKKEPVVIAFWGDHNPWGGNGNSTYNMLGIDLDQSKFNGFNNYFNTPYCMWANDSAKKELKTDFIGNGPQISPMYVLPTIFEHIGIKGDPYMQMLEHLQKQVPVFGLNDRYIYDDKLVSKLPTKVQKEVNDFKIVQYYRQTHLMNN